MFFRFVASLLLVVLVSMIGIAVEKQTLEMKRAVTRQYFQKDLLLEMHARVRLRIQQLTAPSQLTAVSPSSRRSGFENTAAATLHFNTPGTAESVTDTVRRPAVPATSDHTPDRIPDSAPVARLPLLRWELPASNRTGSRR